MRYEQSATESRARPTGNSIVRCARDGSVWQAYTVWVGSNDISGPYPAELLLD